MGGQSFGRQQRDTGCTIGIAHRTVDRRRLTDRHRADSNDRFDDYINRRHHYDIALDTEQWARESDVPSFLGDPTADDVSTWSPTRHQNRGLLSGPA